MNLVIFNTLIITLKKYSIVHIVLIQPNERFYLLYNIYYIIQ
jgi:hypothetical protein